MAMEENYLEKYPYIDKVLISGEEITKRCKELGEIISKDYQGKMPIFIGLLKGSVIFMAELLKNITVLCNTDYMVVKSYVGTESTGDVKIIKDVETPIEGKDIVIVEDIIDTGKTLSKVREIFVAKGAKSIKIVTLVDKPERRTCDITPDYYGFNIPKGFIVGYGLDFNQLYRNLPFIGLLKEEFQK